ncbi:MAG: hypothetical protein ACOH13_11035 [Flavobacteriales bacterium]
MQLISHLLLTALLMIGGTAQAQQVQWLTADTIGYNNNPNIPVHFVCASDAGHVYVARSTELSYLYNTVFGSAVVEQRNALGETLWSFAVGDSVLLQAMASDVDGNVIIGGRFFRALHLGPGSVLPVVNGNSFPETFLICLDSNGDLLWQRNITPNDPGGTDVEAITFDPQGQAWYATCDFFNAEIKRLDDAGNDVETRPVQDAKTIGSLSFDPQGGLYVSGAASAPGITVNGTFYPLIQEYNYFVTRMAVDGTPQWLKSAYDITFQTPRVKADPFGHAYLLGSPMDSLTFGGIHFQGPEWNSSFFLARLDSMGNFQWGFQPPLGAPFSGQFDVGQKDVLGVDGDGNAILLGVTSGAIDWGNDVSSDIGTLGERAVTLLQVDSSGTPQWEFHGGSEGYDVVQGLSVLPDGICHIEVRATDTFQLGGVTAAIASPSLVVARIGTGTSSGVGSFGNDKKVLVTYPSPFTSVFSISTEAFNSGTVDVVLRDGLGRVVSHGDRLDGLGGGLAAGSYLVEVQQEKERWRGRVVKQ